MRKLIGRKSGLLLRQKYNYVPVSNYQIQRKTNPIIEVSFGNASTKLFDLQFRLFENTVPRTSENFKRLLLGTGNYNGRSLSFIGNHFHSILPRAYIELGHLQAGNCSIYGPNFRDESFELPHDRPGLLSCISEQNTNNSRFLITFAPCPFLDLKNVVFGELTAESFHHLRTLQRMGDKALSYGILGTKQIEVKQQHHHGEHGHEEHHH